MAENSDIRSDENHYLPNQPIPESEAGFRWTLQKRRFVHAIARNGNATAAAMEAGYAPTTAGQHGARLVKLVTIRNAVAKELNKLLIAADVSEEWIISRWKQIADANIYDYFEVINEAVTVVDPAADQSAANPPTVARVVPRLVAKNPDELTEEQKLAVKKINIKNTVHGQDVTLELEPRMRALELLAEVTGTIKSGDSATGHLTAEEQAQLLRDTMAAMDRADSGEEWPTNAPHSDTTQ